MTRSSPKVAESVGRPTESIQFPATQSKAPALQNSFLQTSLLSLLHRSAKSVTQKKTGPPVLTHGRSLTTNHLLTKSDLSLTQILTAHQKTPAAHQNLLS